MNRRTIVGILWLALLVVPVWLDAQEYRSGPVDTEQAIVELVSEKRSIAPGERFDLALRFQMDPGWHIYWVNPGDTGMPPQVDWVAPDGFEFGEIRFPPPHRVEAPPGFISYAYEGETLLLIEATAPESIKTGQSATFQADANWLICEEVCIPGSAKLGLTLDVVEPGESKASAEWREPIAKARGALPAKVEGGSLSYEVEENQIALTFEWPGFEDAGLKEAYFFVEQESVVNSAGPQEFEREGTTVRALAPKAEYFSGELPRMSGILYNPNGFEAANGVRALYFDSAEADQGGKGVTLAVESSNAEGSGGFTLGKALFYAFLGGMILNLMPCVFPVISIKVMGFVQQSGEDRKKILNHGLTFAAGVLASFWLLSGLLLALRSAGEQLGWGFQMQNPYFVGVMLVFLFSFGLSLAGVFEVGSSAIGLAGKVESGGYKGSFLSGVLATLVATPCTGPFMSGALGYALTLSAFGAMAVFTFLALGMALPYVLLSANPKLIKKLPRPGRWMETFKQIMAFFLFATCVWLISVMLDLLDREDSVAILGGLAMVAFGAWIYGRWSVPSKKEGVKWSARGAAAIFLVGGTAWLLPAEERLAMLQERDMAELDERDRNLSGIPLGEVGKNGVAWVDYSPKLIAHMEERGIPYYVDFTASWCLICQANKKRVFTSEAVKEKIEELGIVMVKGDWTRQNPVITEVLESFGRSGVPLNIVHTGERGTDPIVLPELLSPEIVLEALRKVEPHATASMALRP